ncbi:MAG: hypothetical protein SGI91_18765 [Alphaproteobacteria bacterium]|jgi:hypothetical protein|nr:hypothetical protein [Alphaproteobacteria bacterium]
MTLVRFLLGLTVAALFAAPAWAAPAGKVTPLAIDIYYGDWQGTATALSETDEDFPSTKRDIAVSVNKTDIGGFLLSWSTLQRQKGNPKAPLEVLKSTTVEFVPSISPNTWRAKADTDPYTGGILYWARLDGRGLVISSFTINTDGRPEYQTYTRRVLGKEMKLEFTNVNDGKFVRTVKGSLRKLR